MSNNLVLSRDPSGSVLMRVLLNPQARAQDSVSNIATYRPFSMPGATRPDRRKDAWLQQHSDFVNSVYDLLLQYIQDRVFPEGHVLQLDSAELRSGVKDYVYTFSV
jgi:hypothetical protein